MFGTTYLLLQLSSRPHLDPFCRHKGSSKQEIQTLDWQHRLYIRMVEYKEPINNLIPFAKFDNYAAQYGTNGTASFDTFIYRFPISNKALIA